MTALNEGPPISVQLTNRRTNERMSERTTERMNKRTLPLVSGAVWPRISCEQHAHSPAPPCIPLRHLVSSYIDLYILVLPRTVLCRLRYYMWVSEWVSE